MSADPSLATLPRPRPASLRELLSRFGTWVNGLPYLSRWLVLASLIGVIAGLGAAVFYELLREATHLFLADIAGYSVPSPAGEGGALGSSHFTRPWAIPLVVAGGALCSGLLVFTFAPEAEGHGTDAAIDAVHNNPRKIRVRAVVIKMIASALTIGSGGSGGREGPTAQISAGFGSLLARVLDLSPEDGRIAVTVGIGSGIGAIFSAPLGGAVLAADILYREDFEFPALIPGVFASIIAYAVFGAFFGYRALFALPGDYHFAAAELPWFALIGLLSGGIGLLYAKNFYGVVALSSRLPFNQKLRPALGGLCVGLLALWLPEVLGTGYGWVQQGISGQLMHIPLYVVILLPLARIVATSLSIGTGGSGGVFGPGMVIGAFTGLAVWRIFEPIAPGLGHSAAPYVVVGMMAVFGGISRAPLAVMVMVAEMTNNAQVLVPAMVAVAIATFIVGRTDDSIYRSQLRTRADSAAARLEFAMPLLATLDVASIAAPPRLVVSASSSAGEALSAIEAARVPGAPVVDDGGVYVGTASRESLARLVDSDPSAPVERVVEQTAATVSVNARLSVALDALSQAGGHWIAVTGESRRVVGVLAVSDLVRAYRRALRTSFGQMASVPGGAVTIEERVRASSPLVGKRLREADLPPGCIVLTVQRGDELLFATGATTLLEGDLVSALATPAISAEVAHRLSGAANGATAPMPGHSDQVR